MEFPFQRGRQWRQNVIENPGSLTTYHLLVQAVGSQDSRICSRRDVGVASRGAQQTAAVQTNVAAVLWWNSQKVHVPFVGVAARQR
jgi:hypothetical protein